MILRRHILMWAAMAVLALGAPAAAQQGGWDPDAPDSPAVSGLSLSGPWMTGPPLELARAGLSAVVSDRRIYAAGGAGLVGPRDDFESYNPETGRWRARAPLPVGLERFAMTAADGRIWVAGGYSSEGGNAPVGGVWSYDPEADIWQSEPEMPGEKASFAMIAVDGRLYALGGEAGATDMFVYDLAAMEWSTRAAPPETARRGVAAVLLDGEIWLIGGASQGRASARVDVYDPAEDSWRRGPDLPAPRAGHAAAVLNGAIHVFGGRSADLRTTLSDHLRLGPEGRWTEAPGMISARTEAAAATLDGSIWLIGGGAGSGFFAPFTSVDSVDVYTPQAD